MTVPIGLKVWCEDGAVSLAVADQSGKVLGVQVVLTPMQARELARVVRNAADFVAAQAPAEGRA
jgi:hypothetical protein